MKITVDVEIRHGGRSGVEARIPELRLTGHGYDENQAKESLRRGVIAWCYGLQSLGKLETTLKQKQLKWEENGENITLELNNLSRL